MRPSLLLVTLPLLAAAPPKGKPVKVTILEASVTWGAGVEPKGPMPPARFQAQVRVEGLRPKAKPELRAWRVLAADLPALQEGAHLRFVRGGLGRLEATATTQDAGLWTVSGIWPGAPKAEERLIVEVWVGPRRVGYGVASLAEHLIPVRSPKADPDQN